MKRSFKDNHTFAVADQALVSGCNFLTVLYITRWMHAADFGYFSLALLCTLFMSNLHRATITQPLNVLASGAPEASVNGRLLRLLRWHVMLIPMAACALAALAYFFFPNAELAAASGLYIACVFVQETLRRYWYTLRRLDRALRSDAIAYGGRLSLIVVAGLHWHPGAAVLFLLMTVPMVAAIAVDVRLLPAASDQDVPASRPLLAQHWPLARWLVPTVLAVWGGSQAYPFLLSPLGPVAVAGYMACRNLLSAATVILQSIDNYLPVRAAAVLRSDGKDALKRHLLSTLGKTAVGGSLFMVFMLIAAESLLHVAYAGAYDAAAPLLRILSMATFATLLGTVLGAYSLAMEDPRASFLSNLGASAVTLTFGAWLISGQGVRGAAIAAVLTAATSLTLQSFFVLSKFQRLPRLEVSRV